MEQVEITIVHAPACHLCDDAEQAVQRLADAYPIVVRLADIRSEEGRALIAEHRPAMNPLILIDGAFFSAGRLSRGKLAKLLTARGPAGTRARP